MIDPHALELVAEVGETPDRGRGLAATRAGLRGVDLNSGILGDVIVGANGKPVRRLADLTDQL